MKELTAEEAIKEWNTFIGYINKYITGERKEKLLKFYSDRQERIMFMPASGNEHFHGAFPTGYLIHVNRVIQGALDLTEIWKKHGSPLNFTEEELVFAALNHDIGKYGTDEHPYYIPNDSEWHRKNQGKIYEHSSDVSKMTVPDRSILILTEHGITFNENEYLAIKTHDGLYEEANKFYLLQAYTWKQKPRTALLYVLHHADMMASRIEFEEWRDNFRDAAPIKKAYAKKTLSTKSVTLSKSACAALDELFKS